jgi:diguanylate cyclase (GGDEF)-like protein
MDHVSIKNDYKREILQPMVVASLLLFIALIALTYVAEDLISLDNQKLELNNLQFNSLKLKNAIIDAETGQRGYILTGNPTFLEPYHQAISSIDRLYKQIRLDIKASGFNQISPVIADIEKFSQRQFLIIDKSIQSQLRSGSYASHLNVQKDVVIAEMQTIRHYFKIIDRDIEQTRSKIESQIKSRFRQVLFGAAALVALVTIVLVTAYRRTMSLFESIVNAKEHLLKLQHQAVHDTLTQIPNRRGFEFQINEIFSECLMQKKEFALFYMDLDGFKLINDVHGHETGDEALKIVVQRFARVLRDTDTLSRVGGDEFTLTVQEDLNIEALTNLSNRLIKSLESKISVAGRSMQLGVSIGIAIFPHHAGNVDDLISMADNAMYAAKKAGKNRVEIARIGLPITHQKRQR